MYENNCRKGSIPKINLSKVFFKVNWNIMDLAAFVLILILIYIIF